LADASGVERLVSTYISGRYKNSEILAEATSVSGQPGRDGF
jgi:hypothetical protein